MKLSRGVVKSGLQQMRKVEVYPINVKLCCGREMERIAFSFYSCMDTLGNVRRNDEMCNTNERGYGVGYCGPTMLVQRLLTS